MVKQFIAEPHKITLSDNTDEAVVTITADADIVTHDTPTHFTGSTVRIAGGEATDAVLELFADQGDDNSDKWRFRVQDGGVLTLETFQSGAWIVTSQWSVASENTTPLRPMFSVTKSGQQSNIAVGSGVTVTFDTEITDQGANFASNTFTAPITGNYLLVASVRLAVLDTASTYYKMEINTSNRVYQGIWDSAVWAQDSLYFTPTMTVIADMDASDTATLTITQQAGTVQTDIHQNTVFSGHLIG